MNLTDLPFALMLLIFGAAGFVQNMVFTAVSRSRNSGDVNHHRKWAYMSNSIAMILQTLVIGSLTTMLVINDITLESAIKSVITLVVYTVSTAEGSCFMMAHMLKTETGKRKVGAS
jgi:hypothetical protein